MMERNNVTEVMETEILLAGSLDKFVRQDMSRNASRDSLSLFIRDK